MITRCRRRPLHSLAAALCSLLLLGARCSGSDSPVPVADAEAAAGAKRFALNRALLAQDLAEITRAPHPLGSPAQAHVAKWLTMRLSRVGIPSFVDHFTARVPNPAALDASAGPRAMTLDRQALNLYTADVTSLPEAGPADVPPGHPMTRPVAKERQSLTAKPCVIALATHYDTKALDGVPYYGANDSASSTAAVLQLLSFVKNDARLRQGRCGVVGWFFDGEEAVLPNWNDGEQRHPAKSADHTYGSRYLASQLTPCVSKIHDCLPAHILHASALPAHATAAPVRLEGLILLDMIGSPGLHLTRDQLSSPELVRMAVAASSYPQVTSREVFAPMVPPDLIDDDHQPFRRLGIPAIDLIDFHHLEFWHKPGDDPVTLDPTSIEDAARIAVYLTALTTHG